MKISWDDYAPFSSVLRQQDRLSVSFCKIIAKMINYKGWKMLTNANLWVINIFVNNFWSGIVSSHRFRCVMDDLWLFLSHCAMLSGRECAAGDDLADLATERAGKSFTTPGGHFCLGLLWYLAFPFSWKTLPTAPCRRIRWWSPVE